MNYVIAVLENQIKAEEAYSLLKREGLPAEQMSLLGKGYETDNTLDFLDPRSKGKMRARLMLLWLLPFGFIAGYAFNASTRYMLVPSIGAFGNHLLGGVLGTIAGAMGSFFVGGGIDFSLGKSNPLSYSKQIKAGKYLLIVKGAPNLTNKANRLLKNVNPENLQGYVDPLTN